MQASMQLSLATAQALSGAQPLLDLVQGWMLSEGIKRRHQGVALLSTFCLHDSVDLAVCIVPQVL